MKFQIRSTILSAMIWLVASGTAAAQTSSDDEATQLAIEAGRLNAMMDQVALLLGVANGEEIAPSTHEDAFSELSDAVRSYNRLGPVACAQIVVPEGICPGSYAPGWLARPPITAKDLRHDIDDAATHLEPFWRMVCAAKDNANHKTCQLE